MNWLPFLIALGAVLGAFLIAEGVKGLFRWLEKKGVKVEQGVVDALLVGIQGAWDEWVRDLKAAAADGKLSAEEKKESRNRAKVLALEVARGPVKKALKAMAPQACEALISLLVQRRKREGDDAPRGELLEMRIEKGTVDSGE